MKVGLGSQVLRSAVDEPGQNCAWYCYLMGSRRKERKKCFHKSKLMKARGGYLTCVARERLLLMKTLDSELKKQRGGGGGEPPVHS